MFMKPAQLKKLQKAVGHHFKNPKMILAALAHPSYRNETPKETFQACFQRLEFLGDSILNLFVAKRLYHLFPKANEGILSRLRSILVSRKLLARIAKTLKLSHYLLLGSQEQKQDDWVKDKIIAD